MPEPLKTALETIMAMICQSVFFEIFLNIFILF